MLYGISRGLKKAITGDYNVELAKQKAKELYELYANIDEILSGLEPYKESYYKTYVGTTFSLSAFPASRLKTLKKIKGGGDSKVKKEVKELKKKKDILKDPEVKKTLERIKSGKKKYDRDGIEYKNDGRGGGEKLPNKGKGYYTEWTVDTPGINQAIFHPLGKK